MTSEILTVDQMYEADKFAANNGVPTLTLMENAGGAVADAIEPRWGRQTVAVLCGPGNNGGDGFAVARLLRERGWDVRLALLGKLGDLKRDAAEVGRRWSGSIEGLSPDVLEDASLVVDALFGAGLSRPLSGAVAQIAALLNASPFPVVAVDVPSGVAGDSGKALDDIYI